MSISPEYLANLSLEQLNEEYKKLKYESAPKAFAIRDEIDRRAKLTSIEISDQQSKILEEQRLTSIAQRELGKKSVQLQRYAVVAAFLAAFSAIVSSWDGISDMFHSAKQSLKSLSSSADKPKAVPTPIVYGE